MFIVAVPLPPALVAVIVKAAVSVTVGVPVITPVVALRVRPAGNDGLADQLVAAPPVFTGAHERSAVPTVYVFEDGV